MRRPDRSTRNHPEDPRRNAPAPGGLRPQGAARALILVAAGLAATACDDGAPLPAAATPPAPLHPLSWVDAPESIELMEGEDATLRLTLTSALEATLRATVSGGDGIAATSALTAPGVATATVFARRAGSATLVLEASHPGYRTASARIAVTVAATDRHGRIIGSTPTCRFRQDMIQYFTLLDADLGAGNGSLGTTFDWIVPLYLNGDCGVFDPGDPLVWRAERLTVVGPTTGTLYGALLVRGRPLSGGGAGRLPGDEWWWVPEFATSFRISLVANGAASFSGTGPDGPDAPGPAIASALKSQPRESFAEVGRPPSRR